MICTGKKSEMKKFSETFFCNQVKLSIICKWPTLIKSLMITDMFYNSPEVFYIKKKLADYGFIGRSNLNMMEI